MLNFHLGFYTQFYKKKTEALTLYLASIRLTKVEEDEKLQDALVEWLKFSSNSVNLMKAFGLNDPPPHLQHNTIFLPRRDYVNKRLHTCFIVTDVMTCRMDQGVTTMMKEREMAERDLTRFSSFTASALNWIGLLATDEPINMGIAEQRAFLLLSFNFFDW